jgi:regulator of cell morphogenesis and NO signaling
MKISSDSLISEVVKLNFKTAAIFQANKIDYCCGGDKTISVACGEVGINPDHLIKQLEIILNQSDPDSEYINKLGLDELCSYIVKRHHEYVRENIPILKNNLDKICMVHGKYHTELHEIRELFNDSADDLTKHMKKEENKLFPFIQRIEFAKAEQLPLPDASFGSVLNPIRTMVAEHQYESERFNKIAKLSNNYLPPADACSTYEVTLKQLREYDKDLRRHIHLENNILFPKTIRIETR